MVVKGVNATFVRKLAVAVSLGVIGFLKAELLYDASIVDYLIILFFDSKSEGVNLIERSMRFHHLLRFRTF